MAISVPAGRRRRGFGNLTFLLIMVALTLVAVVVAVLHPIAWTDEEMRFAVGGAGRRSAVLVVLRGARARQARRDDRARLGRGRRRSSWRIAARPRRRWSSSALFWLGGRLGFGPLAPPPGPDDPIRAARPARRRRPTGWLRPGWLLGHPGRLGGGSAWSSLPLVVYVVSYIPWAMVENHQLVPALAAGPHRPDAARPDRARCTTTTTA